jgi:uncharacterized DUF497 family protein
MRRYEWDSDKAAKNIRKHDGITFEDAAAACDDPLAETRADRIEHGEPRWRTIGRIEGFLLFVAHTIDKRGDLEVWRIISARRTTAKERRTYEQGQS